MRLKIISGGQTGADQAGLRAAKVAGFETGGFAPKGFKTEAEPAAWLEDFGLVEHESSNYPARTRANIAAADATICFDAAESKGTDLAYATCERLKKPFRCVMIDYAADGQPFVSRLTHPPKEIAEWLVENNVRVLNVAGNRESKAPGIGKLVEKYLAAVFGALSSLEKTLPR